MAKGLGRGLGALIPQASSNPAVRKENKQVVESDHSGVLEIPVDKVTPNPNQPRQHFDRQELEDLTSSIKQHGILVPLIVTPKDSGGKHRLIAGERRLRAAKMLSLKKVPVIIRDVAEQEELELSVIENIQRSDLNPIEEALAYQRLASEFNLTQEVVAKRIGKSRSAITNALRLLELDPEVQKAVGEGKISVGHAKILAGLKTEKEQQAYLEKILHHKLTVKDLDQATKKSRRQNKPKGKAFDPVREAQEEMLRERLGTKAIIKKSGEKGQIIIHFYSLEELQRLLNELT